MQYNNLISSYYLSNRGNNFRFEKTSISKGIKVQFTHIFFRNGTETVSIMFSKPEKRANWEESFNEAKQKLGEYNNINILCRCVHRSFPKN